jgi:hypothetical protein
VVLFGLHEQLAAQSAVAPGPHVVVAWQSGDMCLRWTAAGMLEAELPSSFGFRPGRSAHDALQVLVDEAWRGRRWVVETDIANCFRDPARPVDGGCRGTDR